MLRSCFGGAGPLRKPTWTFAFDRRTPVTAEMVEKARAAIDERAVILGTPAAFKAFLLKLLELLHLLDTGQVHLVYRLIVPCWAQTHPLPPLARARRRSHPCLIPRRGR